MECSVVVVNRTKDCHLWWPPPQQRLKMADSKLVKKKGKSLTVTFKTIFIASAWQFSVTYSIETTDFMDAISLTKYH